VVSDAGSSYIADDLEVTRLQRENNNIYANLAQLESEEKVIWGAKSEQIRQLARNYEKLHFKGFYKEPVSHICATIRHELEARNLMFSRWLTYKVLDDHYKQQEQYAHPPVQKHEDSNLISTSGTTTPDQFPFYFSNDSAQGEMFPVYNEPNREVQIDYLLKQQQKATDEMSRDEKRRATEELLDNLKKVTEVQRELRRRSKDMEDMCHNEKIPLSPEYEQEDTEHIGTKYGETGISVAWEAVERYIKMLRKVQDKLYYFKPPMKIARKMSDALDEEIEFWRPMCDEKFRKSTMSWWVVQMDNLAYGKHAAAQMNATILDDKTKRALTREQVGDKAEACYHQALSWAAAQKYRIEFQNWYIGQVEPRIGRRAKELNPTLSEKSFT